MLGQENNLPAMVGAMPNLAIDGLHYGVRLSANGYCPFQVRFGEWLNRTKEAVPSLFPKCQQRLASGRRIDKLEIPWRSGFSPSVVRKLVHRDRILPARCFTTVAMEFISPSSVA